MDAARAMMDSPVKRAFDYAKDEKPATLAAYEPKIAKGDVQDKIVLLRPALRPRTAAGPAAGRGRRALRAGRVSIRPVQGLRHARGRPVAHGRDEEADRRPDRTADPRSGRARPARADAGRRRHRVRPHDRQPAQGGRRADRLCRSSSRANNWSSKTKRCTAFTATSAAATALLFFGGGFKPGLVYGRTADRHPMVPVENPVTLTDVHATIYKALGIPADTHYVTEGRPFYRDQGRQGTSRSTPCWRSAEGPGGPSCRLRRYPHPRIGISPLSGLAAQPQPTLSIWQSSAAYQARFAANGTGPPPRRTSPKRAKSRIGIHLRNVPQLWRGTCICGPRSRAQGAIIGRQRARSRSLVASSLLAAATEIPANTLATCGGQLAMSTATKVKKRSGSLKLQPLGDRVVVEREESESKTAGGIVLPDSAKDKPSRGTVDRRRRRPPAGRRHAAASCKSRSATTCCSPPTPPKRSSSTTRNCC